MGRDGLESEVEVSVLSRSDVIHCFGLCNQPRASRSRIKDLTKWRQDPEERSVWGGCTSSGSRGLSSESGEREEYGGNVIMMMNMTLNATTQDSHSQRGAYIDVTLSYWYYLSKDKTRRALHLIYCYAFCIRSLSGECVNV